MISNILFSNHVYSGKPPTFTVLKPAINPMRVSLRIHTGEVCQQPCAADDRLATKEMMHVTATLDHRILIGFHVNRFGESLKRISSEPKKYLM